MSDCLSFVSRCVQVLAYALYQKQAASNHDKYRLCVWVYVWCMCVVCVSYLGLTCVTFTSLYKVERSHEVEERQSDAYTDVHMH